MWISQGASRSGDHRGAEGLPDNYGSGREAASSWQLVGEDEDRCPGMRCENRTRYNDVSCQSPEHVEEIELVEVLKG